MALQSIPGSGLYVPTHSQNFTAATTTVRSQVIDATGEKIAWIGQVWNKDHATKDIRTVGFRFGTVTKAGGSALTVSLQDVNMTTTPPQPDEVQDQTVAIANADAGFVSNVWYQTGSLSADRTVAFGELLAIVVEYDVNGRLSTDAVNFTGAQGIKGVFPSQSLKTAGWVADITMPNVILGFSDGTFGTLDGTTPFSTISNQSFKQDTGTADEYGNEFSFPFPCKVDGCWLEMFLAADTSNFDIVLYQGTTVLTRVSIDASTCSVAVDTIGYFTFAEQTLAANTVYTLAIQPTQTTSNVTLYYFDVAAANHFQALPLGTTCRLNSRLNLGAWIGAVTTRRLWMGLKISALDDGAGFPTTFGVRARRP